MAILTEHNEFSRLTNALGEARDACLSLAILRDEREWERVAAMLEITKELTYKLVGSGQIISGKGM